MNELSTTESTTAEVARVLRLHSFHYADEEQLQRGVADALTLAGAPFTREVRLDEFSRIDFMVHARCEVGIEAKIASAASSVSRQLDRYLKSDKVDGLVLVTTLRRHKKLAGMRLGKPVEVVWLGFAAL
jgi:hypothetical protein